ncbi:MAG: SHOCT domain-containing protein [Rubrivivax sp.]|nr:SHOCT domain-containing protein [Rubrivivax sp.]
MFYEGGGFMGGMHFLWWIFWIAIVAAFAWALWGRPRDASRVSDPAPPAETPLQILQRRLASGECTPEEYERRRALLDRDRAAGHGPT